MKVRRYVLGAGVLLLVAAVGYSLWLAFQVRDDLRDAEQAADRLQDSLTDSDRARTDATESLQAAASDAVEHTGGAWWGALTHLPLVGDDARAVRALSQSLDTVSDDGIPPLLEVMDRVPDVQRGGRVDLQVVTDLQQPVERAHRAFEQAAARVSGIEGSDLAGALRGRVNEYVARIGDAREGLAGAVTATDVLPELLGADGPRQYLLIFQNNAEIRSTGGLPGSWSLVTASDGDLEIEKQGAGSAFPVPDQPVLPLSDAERKVYGEQLGTYFLDAGFTPDFPRAVELWTAHWKRSFPDQPLDGIVTLDPVALSYLLPATGPVEVGDVTLTQENVVEQLLSVPYRTLDPSAQDLFFAASARGIFQRLTGDLDSPLDLVKGLDRAADEGRLLVSVTDPSIAEELEGSRVLGELAGDDGSTPHVDVAVGDATGSKMSYYLRFTADVDARSCRQGRQQLSAGMNLRQTIPPSEAAQLPQSVTGGGQFGTEPGSQLLLLHLYGPYEGTIDQIRLNGRTVKAEPVELDGRPVATVVVLLSSTEKAVLTWEMQTGPGQTDDVALGMTPSVAPGDNDKVIASAC